jgi:hypothetical protein
MHFCHHYLLPFQNIICYCLLFSHQMLIRCQWLAFYPRWRGRFVAKTVLIQDTYTMEQVPSWEVNRVSVSQEFPRILWKVHYRVFRSPPPVHILNQITPVYPSRHLTSWRSISISLRRISTEKVADIDLWNVIWTCNFSVRAVEVYWPLILLSLRSSEISAYIEKLHGRVIGCTRICYSSGLSLVALEAGEEAEP